MKIKVLVFAAFIGLAAVTNVFGFGLGAQFNFSAGELSAPGAAVVISPTDMTHLAVNWYLDFESVNTVGLTLDVVPLTLPLAKFRAGSLNFTLGIGVYSNITFSKHPDITGGLRIPLGFNLMLAKDVFEIYTHIAPSFGVTFLPGLGLSNPFFPIALGVRFWFR